VKNNDRSSKELTLTRMFDAPRELVWKYWTDQELVAQWWGPLGVTNPTCEWDAQRDGNIHIVMLAGEEMGPYAGQEWPMTGNFEDVQEPEKLVYSSNAIVNDKEVLTTKNTITFEEQDGKTKMTAHILVTKTTPEAEGPLAGMEQGWNQQLDKLVEFIKTNKIS